MDGRWNTRECLLECSMEDTKMLKARPTLSNTTTTNPYQPFGYKMDAWCIVLEEVYPSFSLVRLHYAVCL